jgi:hypothetical protein
MKSNGSLIITKDADRFFNDIGEFLINILKELFTGQRMTILLRLYNLKENQICHFNI